MPTESTYTRMTRRQKRYAADRIALANARRGATYSRTGSRFTGVTRAASRSIPRRSIGVDFGTTAGTFFEDTPSPAAPTAIQLSPEEIAALEDAQIDAELDAEALAKEGRKDQIMGTIPMVLLGVVVIGGAYWMWNR